MSVFLLCVGVISALSIALLVWPLLRPRADSGVSQERVNAHWHTDQLAALQADLASGRMSAEGFAQAKEELALRLLDEQEADRALGQTDSAALHSERSPRVAIGLGVLVAVLAFGQYAFLGAPGAIDPEATARLQRAEVEQMVEGLAERLRKQPDDPMGWAMLGRSYKMLDRPEAAAEAFEKAGPLLQSHPDVMASYAELLATQGDSKMSGRAAELVGKALQINPQHPMSLMLAGAGAFRAQDYALAVRFWERLQQQLEPESADWNLLQGNIDEARTRGGIPAPAAGATAPATPAAASAPAAPSSAAAAGAGAPDPVAMVERLAARLKAQPDDPAGWARLGRAYTVLGRLEDAEAAFRRSGLIETDANVKAHYAELQSLRKRRP